MWRKSLRFGTTFTIIMLLVLSSGMAAIGENPSPIADVKAKIDRGADLSTAEKQLAEDEALFSSNHADVNPLVTSSSRTAVLDESFEGETFPPDGWTAVTTDTGDDGWGADMGTTHGPGTVADGSYAAMADIYWMSSGTVANLTSPAVDLSTLTAPELRFYVQGSGGSDPDPNLTVNMSVDAGSTWMELYNQDSDGSIDAWGQVVIDLAAYGSETAAMFDFVATSDYGSYNIFVDAVTVADAPTDPAITLSATDIDMGDVPVGFMNSYYLMVGNAGGADLTISDISSTLPEFAVSPATGTVAPGASLEVMVTFTPTAIMAYSDSITIVSNDAGSPATVYLMGNGLDYLTSGGPDAAGYVWINNLDEEGPVYSWIDTVGAMDADIAYGDDYRGTIDLPFEFRFYNEMYTQITATTNGWIGMGPSTGYSSSYWTNTTIPSTAYGPNNIIAPLWDDFKAGDSPGSSSSAHGTIKYKTLGEAPNRQFVVIFDEVVRSTFDDDYFSFEVILDEATSDITMQYADVTGNSLADYGVGGTIGIENMDASDGLLYEFNGDPQLIYSGVAVKFIAPPPPSGYTGVVVVNEIHYNPSSDQGSDNDFEFAELYNTSDAPVDMTGWFLNDVALDVTIDADSFVVVAYTGATYAALNVPVVDAAGYFGLSNTAGTLEIVDATGLVVDLVAYTDDPPWPSAADGTGPSMELMDAMYDNNMGENWQASFVANGTPGLSNSTAPPAIPYTINELQTVDHSGDMVSITGIVMSVFEGLYTVQEASGAFSGIWVAGGDVALGDSVTVEGIVGESYDLTQVTAANLIVHGSNYDLFEPAVLPTGLISVEDYEGVLVFTSGDVDNADIGFGEWSINDGSGAVVIDDLGYVASPTLDVFFEVAGPLYYSFGAFKIEPRDEMDVIDWSPGNYCENPLSYGVAGDPEMTGSIESYGAVWYVVETLEDFDSLYVSLCGSDFDTKLEVWAACEDETYLAYNDDNFAVCGPGYNSHIELLDVPAGMYYVKVYGFSSSFGTYALNIWGANGIAPGSTCDTAIEVVGGENAASGNDEWFAFTATMDGIVKISSQNETGDAPWDTRLDVFDGCDEEAVLVASNDDCCGYWGPSTVEFLGAAGMTYYIFWDDVYGPGPFPWFIDELPNAPSDLMAEGGDGYVDLSWTPPVGAVIASAGNASFAATNNNNTVMKLAEKKAEAQEAAAAKRVNAPAMSDLSTSQILNMTPLDRHSAILFPMHIENTNGLRTSDVTISVTVDAYPGEASWNLYDYTTSTYYYTEDQLFTAGGENQTVILALADGGYSVDVWDSFGDGGVAGTVSLGDGTVLASWTDGDYTSFGEFGFSVLEGAVYGCTDPDAMNYDETATVDDGSCYYEGDFCDVAIPAMTGLNAASGLDQWFEYTATMDGEITVHSQNETGDAPWDTYLFIFDSCDPEASPIASNDDAYGYFGPSSVDFPTTNGMTYYIFWANAYGPGPFDWTLDEHELILCDDTIVPDGVAEVEPNGGENSDPVEYDPRVCGDLITGTYWASAIDGRDTDWFNFTLTEHSVVDAWIDVACGDPMIFIIDANVAIVGQGADNGEGMGEELMTGILPPGDYWFWVGSQVFEGNGDEYNYNAGFSCTPMEPTSYTVYRDDAELETGIYAMQFRDFSVENGTEYCYTVTATMDDVETIESNVACATPNMFFPEPMGLMAAAFDAEVDLGWSAPFPMGQLAYDDGTAESWYWVGGPSVLDQMFYSRLMVPSDGGVTHIAIWHAADDLVNWNAIYVTGDDGAGAPDMANAYEVFVDVPVGTPIGAGGEWAVLELTVPAAVTAGQDLYIVTQWPDASDVGPFVATDDDTDLGNAAWTNTGGAAWNIIPGTFIMRAYMQDAIGRENIEITAVPREVESNLPVRSLDDNKTLRGKLEDISFSLAAPALQSNAMRELTSYNVYRGEEPGMYTLIADNIMETFYQDMSVMNGTAYFYAVSAVYDGVFESGFSNEVLALPLGAGSIPYANNFDETNGGFFGGGEWQWGAPLDPPGAASAPNVWGTVLDGPYSNGVTSFLELPFDLSGSEYGYELSFMAFQDIEDGWDYGYVGVDHDGDANYDIIAEYTGQLGEWLPESVLIPPMYTSEYTKVAFIFQSDGSVTYDGWYIDDVEVNEFMPAIMVSNAEAFMDTLLEGTGNTHALDIGNIGGLDLEYFGGIEYIDGVSLDTLFFDNFDAGLSTDWTVVDGADDGYTWNGITDDAGNTVDGTPFVFVDSDAAGSVDMFEELISPMVDTEDALSLTLEWDQYFNAYSGNEIADVDVWDGIEWVNVYSTSEDMGYWLDPDHPVIDITPFANADLQVRFHYYNANYDWYWAVDNVLITVEEGVPWVTVDGGVTFGGMVPVAGADNSHLLALDATELEAGVYHANIWIMSNGGEMVIPVELVVNPIVSTDDRQIPLSYALEQNYPNPFNPVTSIQYALPEAADVRIIVYNVLGQKVATLVEAHKTAGYHHVMWSGTDQLGAAVSSGVYLYRIETANFSDVKKLMLLK